MTGPEQFAFPAGKRMYLKKHINLIYWAGTTIGLAVSLAALYIGFVYTPPGAVHKPPKLALENSLKPVENATSAVSVKLKNTLIKHLSNGEVKWEVKAGGIETSAKDGRSEFTSPAGKFFADKGRMFTFSALSAVYDPDGKRLRVSGPFTGTLEPEGHQITARNMLWNQSTSKLTASSPGITMDHAKASADSLEIDTASRTVSLRGGVRIEIPLHKDKAQ